MNNEGSSLITTDEIAILTQKRNNSNQESVNLSKTSLKALKGKSWSSFLEKPNDVQALSAVNITTTPTPKTDVANRKIVKIPSNWKLVPIKMRDTQTTSKIPSDALNIDASGISKATLLCLTGVFF